MGMEMDPSTTDVVSEDGLDISNGVVYVHMPFPMRPVFPCSSLSASGELLAPGESSAVGDYPM